jgi:predicted  nucleic acid-binding Zn-ribbon protein
MENTVAQKLDALKKLQEIDSALDEIAKIAGALPDEVGDLEDEIAGYQTRIDKFQQEIDDKEQEIQNTKVAISDAEKLIKKYEEQQMNVRNNREYDAITKEMELQTLEIQICEKRIKEAHAAIDEKKGEIESVRQLMDERNQDLASKQKELDVIISENKEREQKLKEEHNKAATKVEDRLLKSYIKIRDNAQNGLAVVSVTRSACGGCFNIVPPQRQAEIRERKKIIVCEHCGRVLADVEDPEPEILEKKTKRKARK